MKFLSTYTKMTLERARVPRVMISCTSLTLIALQTMTLAVAVFIT